MIERTLLVELRAGVGVVALFDAGVLKLYEGIEGAGPRGLGWSGHEDRAV